MMVAVNDHPPPLFSCLELTSLACYRGAKQQSRMLCLHPWLNPLVMSPWLKTALMCHQLNWSLLHKYSKYVIIMTWNLYCYLPAEMSDESPIPVSRSCVEFGFASCCELCNTTGGWDAGLCPKMESICSKYLYVRRFRPDLWLCVLIFL